MRLRTHKAVLVQIVLLGLSLPAFAQNTGAPTRGASMAQVEQRYGAPLQRHAPVGHPPITRWDYADYRLYFESDHVLHAVVPGEPVPIVNQTELMDATPE